MLCLAGPHGDDARRMLEPGSRLLCTFSAGSHFEAMQEYHAILGREPYTTEHEWDYQPYPHDWL